MDEENRWLTTSKLRFLVRQTDAIRTPRKTRLLFCSFARTCWKLLEIEAAREAVEVCERYADGLAGFAELRQSRIAVQSINKGSVTGAQAHAYRIVLETCQDLPHRFGEILQVHQQWENRILLCNMTRDIIGNPFRPLIFDPAWRTSTVLAHARPMYDARDFLAMPILADALEDAGCDKADVLDHCRDSAGVHVRGCWVVDEVLGHK